MDLEGQQVSITDIAPVMPLMYAHAIQLISIISNTVNNHFKSSART